MLPQEALLLWKIYTEQVLFYFAHSKVFCVYRQNITPALHKLRTPHYVHSRLQHITLNFISQSGFSSHHEQDSAEKEKEAQTSLQNIKACSIFGVCSMHAHKYTHPRFPRKRHSHNHNHINSLSALLYCTSYPRMIMCGLKMPTRPRREEHDYFFLNSPSFFIGSHAFGASEAAHNKHTMIIK